MAEERQEAGMEAAQGQGAEPAAQEGADDRTPAARPRKGRIRRARNLCVLVVFLSIVAGLLLRAGWGTLCSLGFEQVFLACPVGALEALVAGRAAVPRLLVALACAVLLILLLGRTFCSWGCVVPPISRFFHPKGGKGRSAAGGEGASEADAAGAEPAAADATDAALAPSSCAACSGCASEGAHGLAPVGGKRDGLQIDTRHGVLVGAIVSSAVCGFPVFCLVCPIGLSIALVVGIYTAIFEQNPTVSLLVFAGIIVIELAFFRKWCHKLCPVGAFMSLVGFKAPLAKPRVDDGKCLRAKGIDCRVCVEVCPEELDPHSRSIPECTRCGQCIERCPAGAISFKRPKRPNQGPAD